MDTYVTYVTYVSQPMLPLAAATMPCLMPLVLYAAGVPAPDYEE